MPHVGAGFFLSGIGVRLSFGFEIPEFSMVVGRRLRSAGLGLVIALTVGSVVFAPFLLPPSARAAWDSGRGLPGGDNPRGGLVRAVRSIILHSGMDIAAVESELGAPDWRGNGFVDYVVGAQEYGVEIVRLRIHLSDGVVVGSEIVTG